MNPHELPTYAQLQARTDAPPGSAWHVFGPDDELGTINLLDNRSVLAAAGEIRTGDVFALNWRVDLPSPNPWRDTPQRTQVAGGDARDDFLTPFYLQFSTQWDGLRHVGLPEGFYNGIPADVVDDADSTTLGIQGWAERGIVGRGVLLDVARHAELMGRPIDPSTRFCITPELLDATADTQGVTLGAGDILLIRTGWVRWYETLEQDARAAAMAADAAQVGVEPSERIAGWLWDKHVAAVAADNLAVEVTPLDMTPGNFLHYRIIGGFGMPIGELFRLEHLAAFCADVRRWSFLFASAPLNVPGGVGSPANALAIC